MFFENSSLLVHGWLSLAQCGIFMNETALLALPHACTVSLMILAFSAVIENYSSQCFSTNFSRNVL